MTLLSIIFLGLLSVARALPNSWKYATLKRDATGLKTEYDYIVGKYARYCRILMLIIDSGRGHSRDYGS